MNTGQLTTLKKFGSDCICVNGTHGVNSYQFELHTLLVLDDLRQGFPCCFCISNRSDETIMSLFYDCVKKESGLIEAKVFMSDMADVYYNAWSKVMTETHFRLYCTWHVDRAWRKNLTLIKTKEKQELVYKNLRVLLQETDPSAFEPMLNSFIENTFDNPSTVNFGRYFQTNYASKTISWAYCYRMHAGLNTNMHIERMHRTIKYIYLQGRNNKRLDKAVTALMKFIRDKLFDRLIILNKGKLSYKIIEIRKRENDVECDCQLICTDCNVCIHKYSCSCLDSAIAWNMCKHIHLLCRYRQLTKESSQEEQKMEIVEDQRAVESEIIFEELDNKSAIRCESLVERKEEMLRHLYVLVNGVKTEQEWTALEKMVNPIEPILTAISQQTISNFESKDSKPSNAKILKQRRLFSTKKKPSKKKHLTKPTSEECNTIAINLLN
ncbi:uncharacterized protein [Diabrotica undecimpunctata]|uniref:uncharacterized protein n=1 Tax=Diabrotica undecimpunctata TaxID=50387 RepID=UPI003B63B12D